MAFKKNIRKKMRLEELYQQEKSHIERINILEVELAVEQ